MCPVHGIPERVTTIRATYTDFNDNNWCVLMEENKNIFCLIYLLGVT
jgi:hypothetical protein